MERYDRQLLINGWNQDSLSRAKVILFGAGALGNEILKNLALIGVGHILVVDFDVIEISNLSRTVLFRDTDVGRSKAQAAAEAASRLNPEIDVRYINGNLHFDIGLGFYRHADLVISGLDNIAARSHVGLSCTLAGTPFLDGGMWAMGGEVRWFMPDEGACYECTLTHEDRKRAFDRRSCTGFRIDDGFAPPMPSTMSTTAIIGGILTQEVIRFLCGWKTPISEGIVFNGLSQTIHKTDFTRNPNCPYHQAYQNVIELDAGVTEMTAKELIQHAEKYAGKPVILELGRDFLLGLNCDTCNRYEPVEELLGRVEEQRAICPECGKDRKAEIISRLESKNPHGNRKLNELGVPQAEVLAVRFDEQLHLYEFRGDVHNFWE